MLTSEPMQTLIGETNNILSEAYQSGIDDNVIPQAMDAKMRESVFLFSACKTHQELSEASQMLRAQDGRIKSFSQFAADVTRVHTDYNIKYLRAEYGFAVSSSQMAARWAEVEKDGDNYNLQYRTADDASVRETHRVLHNITLPASDPFWDQYMPPNGWGCRCTAVQVRKTKYETSDPSVALEKGLQATQQIRAGVDTGAIFRFNPGKSRQIFPPKHPYYKMAAEDKKAIKKIVQKYNSLKMNDLLPNETITENDIKNVIHAYADKFRENYNGGLLSVGVKRTSSAFMSNGRYRHKTGNILTLHNYNFNINGTVFNPVKEIKGALEAIRAGKSMIFTQEYAMESLWHETLHAKANGWSDRKLRNETTVMQMETINQFVARHTYPKFIEQLGGKAVNQSQVLEQGYGYGTYVTNFREMLKHHKIKESDVVDAISDKLLNEPYENIGANTIEFLKKQGISNPKKFMDLLDLNQKAFANLLNQDQ